MNAGARASFARAALRVALLVVAAAVIYGSWAAFANLRHGSAAALRAGLTQGASSGTTTLVIGSILEALHATLPPRRYRALLATVIAASITAMMHVGLHLATGTPEILRAVLPSIVMGYVFAGAYARSLQRRAVAVPATRADAGREA